MKVRRRTLAVYAGSSLAVNPNRGGSAQIRGPGSLALRDDGRLAAVGELRGVGLDAALHLGLIPEGICAQAHRIAAACGRRTTGSAAGLSAAGRRTLHTDRLLAPGRQLRGVLLE